MGLIKAAETAFQTFNHYLSSIVRKRNASIVGPSKQMAGEFPAVGFDRLFEYYHHWDHIKRSVDTMHQKFMGTGINIQSNNDDYNYFISKWMETINFQQKMSDFFLSVFITGNGILELQYDQKRRIANMELIPMQTIHRIFRDEFANEIKLVQNVDGIFKELDPQFYVHWMINNPDRQAFGKSEFFSAAAPRKVSGKIDPDTGQAVNPDRNTISLLDAQAELQNAEVEIKKMMAKPRIFASFQSMPEDQLKQLQQELQDPNSSQTIWVFDREAKMTEAQIQSAGKYDAYGDNVDKHIDIATGFASQVIAHPGGFSYSSSQTPIDVLDQRMIQLQGSAKEMIRDFILRPHAHSWGITNFDDFDVQISFMPSIRKLTMEDIQKLPIDAVSPEEKREILKMLNVPLDDSKWEDYRNKVMGTALAPKGARLESPTSQTSSDPTKARIPEEHEKDRPKPQTQSREKAIENYIDDMIDYKIRIATERLTINPKVDRDLSIPGGIGVDEGPPEVTDQNIMEQILEQFDGDDPELNDEDSQQTGNRDLIQGSNNKELDTLLRDVEEPFWLDDDFEKDFNDIVSKGDTVSAGTHNYTIPYRKTANSPNDNTGQTSNSGQQKTNTVPKQAPMSDNDKLRRGLKQSRRDDVESTLRGE